jgi:hypothetical protein
VAIVAGKRMAVVAGVVVGGFTYLLGGNELASSEFRVRASTERADGFVRFVLEVTPPPASARSSCECLVLEPSDERGRIVGTVDCRRLPPFVIPGVWLEGRTGARPQLVPVPCR